MEVPADEAAKAGQLGAAQVGQLGASQAGQLNAPQVGQLNAPQAGQLSAAHHHAQPHVQTLGEAVQKFLNNSEAHFGEPSRQMNRIRSFLGLFLNGDMDKLEAFSSIQATINGQAALSIDLADVLNHRDASRAGGDADFDPNPSHSWLDFMQTSHEPQMRALSVPASTPTTQPSTMMEDLSFPDFFDEPQMRSLSLPTSTSAANSSTMIEDLPRLDAFDESQMRSLSMPSSTPTTNPSPMIGELSLPNAFDEPQMGSLSMPASTSTANPSTMIGDISFPDAVDTPFKTSYGDNLRSNYAPITHNNWASWPAVESSSPMLQASSNFSYPGQSVPPSNTMMTNQWGMSAQNTGNLSTRNSWSSYDSNQSFQQPLEPSNPYIVRASQSPMISPGMNTTPPVLGDPLAVPIGQPRGQMPPPTNSIRRPIAPRKQSKELEGNNLDQPQRSASVPKKAKRSKVGGPQQNERPFIHALCGKSFGTRYRVKKHHWGVKVDDLDTETGCWAEYHKPNVDWDAHPSCSEAPATRKAKKPAAKVIQKEKEGEDQISQDMGSYHSHRMPSQDSFDTLLSAVNMVAHIDMPKPHDQNRSAASHLESQVLAMEDQMPHTSASFDAQGGKEPDESEHGTRLLRANGSQMYPPEHESWQKYWSASASSKTTATNDHINSNPLKRGSMSFESDFLGSSEENGKARKMSKE